jgi:hypothetical protein
MSSWDEEMFTLMGGFARLCRSLHRDLVVVGLTLFEGGNNVAS